MYKKPLERACKGVLTAGSSLNLREYSSHRGATFFKSLFAIRIGTPTCRIQYYSNAASHQKKVHEKKARVCNPCRTAHAFANLADMQVCGQELDGEPVGNHRVGPAPLGSGQCVLPRLHLGNVLVRQLIRAPLQDLVEVVSRVCPAWHHQYSKSGTKTGALCGKHKVSHTTQIMCMGFCSVTIIQCPESAQCKHITQIPGSTLSSTGSRGKRMMLSASTIKMKSSFGSRSCTRFRLLQAKL